MSQGILTDNEITAEIQAGRLIIGGKPEFVQACSYDLRIGAIFDGGKIVKLGANEGNHVVIAPGEIKSLLTLEELQLPNNVAATAFAMNAMSSEGILVLNPGHIDPGYHGPLSVRLINIRATPKVIPLGIAIFTVIFERLPTPVGKPYEKNRSRDSLELAYLATDVQQNPGSLYSLILSGKDKPLMTEAAVKRVVTEHWMSKLVTAATVIAGVFAVLATIVTLVLAFKPDKESTKNSESTAVSCTCESPSSAAPQSHPPKKKTDDSQSQQPEPSLPVQSKKTDSRGNLTPAPRHMVPNAPVQPEKPNGEGEKPAAPTPPPIAPASEPRTKD